MNQLFVILHRWIGVALCLFFVAWFASGVIMIYVPFPSLSVAERLERAPPVDLSNIVDPVAGILELTDVGFIDRIRLIAFDGRPLFIAEGVDDRIAVRYADTGVELSPLTARQAATIAERFSSTDVVSVDGPFDYDQWVVHQQFDRYRPFFRVSVSDGQGTDLYVSQVTGEVLQRTRGGERAWNYAGAVVHWIYPTFIRKNWVLWDQLVWWVSLVGILGALLGITLGIVRLREARRRGRSGIASAFVGWMRWHHQLGIVVGALVITWTFSGWLSMDHGRLFSVPDPTPDQVSRFRGVTLPEALSRISAEQLRNYSGVVELEISAIAGQPVVIVSNVSGLRAEPLSVDGSIGVSVSTEHIERAVEVAWPDAAIVESYAVSGEDWYVNLREGSLGSGAIRVVLSDDRDTWVHVDQHSGKILSVMDRSRRIYRWLFNGLHSLDFPGFVDRRPLWDLTMIGLLAAGLAFSLTGVIVGFRRLRLSLTRQSRPSV